MRVVLVGRGAGSRRGGGRGGGPLQRARATAARPALSAAVCCSSSLLHTMASMNSRRRPRGRAWAGMAAGSGWVVRALCVCVLCVCWAPKLGMVRGGRLRLQHKGCQWPPFIMPHPYIHNGLLLHARAPRRSAPPRPTACTTSGAPTWTGRWWCCRCAHVCVRARACVHACMGQHCKSSACLTEGCERASPP